MISLCAALNHPRFQGASLLAREASLLRHNHLPHRCPVLPICLVQHGNATSCDPYRLEELLRMKGHPRAVPRLWRQEWQLGCWPRLAAGPCERSFSDWADRWSRFALSEIGRYHRLSPGRVVVVQEERTGKGQKRLVESAGRWPFRLERSARRSPRSPRDRSRRTTLKHYHRRRPSPSVDQS